jgi:nitrogen fixation/metabolism regulation signal transduction histidine kinase
MGITVAAVAVASASTYLLLSGSLSDENLGRMIEILVVQTSLLLVAVFALGVFTTHRLAGPWIAIRRALEDVADGNLNRRLTLRQSDTYLEEVEVAFNDMMETLSAEKVEAGRPDAGSTLPGASTLPASSMMS